MSISKLITEKRQTEKDLYFDTYTSAVDTAIKSIEASGFDKPDPEMLATEVGLNSRKPSRGKTTRLSIPVFKGGVEQKKRLHIQVYNRETDKKPYELNYYIQWKQSEKTN